MRTLIHPLLALGLCTLPLGAGVPAPAPITAIASQAPATLDTARARRLDPTEREALLVASARRGELGKQRAGDFDLHLSDRDLRVIGIAVVITLLIIVIA